MNIKQFKWERALQIAVENRTHVDTVVAYRKQYLERMKREENLQMFIQYGQDLPLDWEAIKGKIRADKDREEEAAK